MIKKGRDVSQKTIYPGQSTAVMSLFAYNLTIQSSTQKGVDVVSNEAFHTLKLSLDHGKPAMLKSTALLDFKESAQPNTAVATIERDILFLIKQKEDEHELTLKIEILDKHSKFLI